MIPAFIRRTDCLTLQRSENDTAQPYLRELLSKMNIDRSPEQWYALQLRTRRESSTATLLSGKGYQTFLPTYKTAKQVRGKSCEVDSPLFPGYVFCRFDAYRRLPVLLTPGVISVVGRGRIPIPVEDSEIEAIQKVVSTGLQPEPWPYLEAGQMIRIEDGALSGIEGVLIGFKGARRIVVSVSLLRRSVALEIDRSVVCAIQPTQTVPAAPVSFSHLLEPAVA